MSVSSVKPSNFSTAGPVSVARVLGLISNASPGSIVSLEDVHKMYTMDHGNVSLGHTSNVLRFLKRSGALLPDSIAPSPELLDGTVGDSFTDRGKFWFIRHLYPTMPPFRDVVDWLFSEAYTWESLLEKVCSLHNLNKWGRQKLDQWCEALTLTLTLLDFASVHPWIDGFAKSNVRISELRAGLDSIVKKYGGPNNQVLYSTFEEEVRSRVLSGAGSKRLVDSLIRNLSNQGSLSISRGKEGRVYVSIHSAGLPEDHLPLETILLQV